MKLKLSVFVGVVLCLVLMGLYGVLSRMFDSRDGWRPNDMYSLVGGSSYSTVSYSSSSSQFGGAGVPAVSVRRGSSFSRRAAAPAFSYAPAYAPTSSGRQWSSSSAQSPISYTASSATMKSFGGGGNMATSAFGGATGNVTSTSAAAPVGVSVSMPSTSMYAYANNRTSTSSVELPSAMSGEITLATASSYAGIGNTTAGGPMGIRGRRNVGVQDTWLGWLGSDMWGHGGGSDDVTMQDLRNLYAAMTGDTDFSNQELWESFLAWFNGNQSDETFGWHWAPLSDAIPFVLLLSLLYAWFIYRKTKKQTA